MGTLRITRTAKCGVLIRWKEACKYKFFLLFPFILVNQAVGSRRSIADLHSHLRVEARTPQWPWVAVTDWVILSETRPALHLRAKPNTSFHPTGLLVNDKALLSSALCLWQAKGGCCDEEPKGVCERKPSHSLLAYASPELFFVRLASTEKEEFSLVTLAVTLNTCLPVIWSNTGKRKSIKIKTDDSAQHKAGALPLSVWWEL